MPSLTMGSTVSLTPLPRDGQPPSLWGVGVDPVKTPRPEFVAADAKKCLNTAIYRGRC
jgi:hypothetical protein